MLCYSGLFILNMILDMGYTYSSFTRLGFANSDLYHLAEEAPASSFHLWKCHHYSLVQALESREFQGWSHDLKELQFDLRTGLKNYIVCLTRRSCLLMELQAWILRALHKLLLSFQSHIQ